MIKEIIKEYTEDNLVVRTIKITFCGIPIFIYKKTSTNQAAVKQFTTKEVKPTHIKGFKYETKNKSKKN